MKDFNIPREQKIERLTPNKEKKPRFSGSDKINYFITAIGFLVLLYIALQAPEFIFAPLKRVNVIGNESFSKVKILQELKLGDNPSWFDFDPYIVSRRLTRNPLIKTALVKRNLLFGIDVFIEEKKPVAYLKTKNKIFLLGKSNLILQEIDGTRGLDLPVIVNTTIKKAKTGDVLPVGTLIKAYQMMNFLSNNPILPLEAVSEIIVNDPLNIQLITIPYGLRIKMGYEKFSSKLAKLPLAEELLSRIRDKIAYIDLRNPRGIVIKKKNKK